MDAKKLFELAQVASQMSAIGIMLGRMEVYQETMQQPILVQLQLADPQRTSAAINSSLISYALKSRFHELVEQLKSEGIEVDGMLADLGAFIDSEKQKNQQSMQAGAQSPS